MRAHKAGLWVGIVVLASAAFATPAVASPSTTHWGPTLSGPGHNVHVADDGETDVNVCSTDVGPGKAKCLARVRTRAGNRHATLGNQGAYDPNFLQSAYNAPSSTKGKDRTVAIVDAYDSPQAEADMAFYRAQFGLPACTSASGCFKKIDQNGNKNYPAYDAGWAIEISLDIDMVSALCPKCNIVLVEANSNSLNDLLAAERTAAARANVVSNSWGSNEFGNEALFDSAFSRAGVTFTASSGDSGYGTEWPAASPNVVAVGGTTLLQQTNTGTRNATETVWKGAGSGCSSQESKPAWQADTGCAKRAIADVSAVADPNTGVWVYDNLAGGWGVVGGTSAAAPIIAAFYAMAGSANTNASGLYAHNGGLNDITSGSNGSCKSAVSYLCKAKAGYDGPTGLGTPNGVGAFDGSAGNAQSQGDFTLTAKASSKNVRHGRSVQFPLTITPQNGFAGAITFSVSGIGANDTWKTTTVTAKGNATLTIKAAKTDAIGTTYVVHLTATSGSLAHSLDLTVHVT